MTSEEIIKVYVELHKDKYNEDFLINKETGKICW